MRDGNAANHHRLAGLLERRHPMNVESVTHPEREGLDLVLGLENIVAIIFLLGEQLSVACGGYSAWWLLHDGGGRRCRSRGCKGVGVAEADEEGNADETHLFAVPLLVSLSICRRPLFESAVLLATLNFSKKKRSDDECDERRDGGRPDLRSTAGWRWLADRSTLLPQYTTLTDKYRPKPRSKL